MSRKPVRWVDALKRIFSPVRTKRRWSRLRLEELGDRINPVTFTPDGDSLVGDGDPNSLRDVLNDANDANEDVIIELDFGETYTLDIANNAGQENNNAEGDLDIRDDANVPGGKTYTFVG